jgi:hypothetical protein
MIGIYLSYRRMDAAAYAGRLFDHLGQHFGPGSVFRDIDTIRRGEDFAQAIESALNASDVVLVVIGNTWDYGARWSPSTGRPRGLGSARSSRRVAAKCSGGPRLSRRG